MFLMIGVVNDFSGNPVVIFNQCLKLNDFCVLFINLVNCLTKKFLEYSDFTAIFNKFFF